MLEQKYSYLFICGPSRSGTAMLRSVLNQSRDVSLSGETHYFDDLRERFGKRTLDNLNENEIDQCCDYFRRQTVRPYGKGGDANDSWISRSSLYEQAKYINESSPSISGSDAIFMAYCTIHGVRDSAKIIGEKTPRHVFRIDDILTLIPDAKIICMVRDPRAVVASYRDWTYRGGLPVEGNSDYIAAVAAEEQRSKSSYHIVIATKMWLGAVGAATKALKKYGSSKVKIVKYEDIVKEPRIEIEQICDWLGIPYDEYLLEIPLHNSSSSDYIGNAGVSKAPQNRWLNVLNDSEISVIEWVGFKGMKILGYTPKLHKPHILPLLGAYITLPIAVVRAAIANRGRYSSLPLYIWKRLSSSW